MTPAQYHCVAWLLRLPEHSAAAARMVLVDGARLTDAAAAHDLPHQSVSRTASRVRRAYDEIAQSGPWAQREYSPQERSASREATTPPPRS